MGGGKMICVELRDESVELFDGRWRADAAVVHSDESMG